MHFGQPEYSTATASLTTIDALKMLSESAFDKLGELESPKPTSKFEFIYKKHFPDKADALTDCSASTQSTFSAVSLAKKLTPNSKAASNVMNKLLEEIKTKSYQPFKFPNLGLTAQPLGKHGKTVINLHTKAAVSSEPSDEDSPKYMLKAKALTDQAGFKKVFAYDLGPKQQPIVWAQKEFNSVLEPAQNVSGKDSDDVSEGEIAAILKEVDRSRGYLGKFVHVNFDWDRQSLSQYLQLDLSEEERRDYLQSDEIDSIPDLTYLS